LVFYIFKFFILIISSHLHSQTLANQRKTHNHHHYVRLKFLIIIEIMLLIYVGVGLLCVYGMTHSWWMEVVDLSYLLMIIVVFLRLWIWVKGSYIIYVIVVMEFEEDFKEVGKLNYFKKIVMLFKHHYFKINLMMH